MFIHRSDVAGSINIYTITAGKDLYVSSLTFVAMNEHNLNYGQTSIRDGGTGGTLKWQFKMPKQATGTNAVPLVVPMVFPEPVQLLTDIWVIQDAGTTTWSISVVGYEE